MNGGLRGAAHAKLNLRLCVLARESSGFHQIETLFCRLELADDVEVSRGGRGVTLEVLAANGPPPLLGPVENNLAVRAAHAFFREARLEPGAAITLRKRIPAGAGLGGGSSNAAAVLALLNRMHGEVLSAPTLLRLGAALGSDVPFFLSGAALALGWGRGGRLLPLPPLPVATVLLAVPREAVSTADAYALLAAQRAETVAPLPAVLPPQLAAWEHVRELATNDFEDVIFERLPLLAEVRDALAGAGAQIAMMTGTGSVVFGVFADEAAARSAAQRLEVAFAGVAWVLTRTP